MRIFIAEVGEGKNWTLAIGCFEHIEDAVQAVKGKGLGGVGDGEVWEYPIQDHYTAEGKGKYFLKLRGEKVYGYRRNPSGKWGYGYVDNRDATKDPEYDNFVRLAKKFGVRLVEVDLEKPVNKANGG